MAEFRTFYVALQTRVFPSPIRVSHAQAARMIQLRVEIISRLTREEKIEVEGSCGIHGITDISMAKRSRKQMLVRNE